MGKAPSHKKDPVIIPKWAKDQERFTKGKNYPHCKGTFPDCPEKIEPDVVPDVCKTCPFFKT